MKTSVVALRSAFCYLANGVMVNAGQTVLSLTGFMAMLGCMSHNLCMHRNLVDHCEVEHVFRVPPQDPMRLLVRISSMRRHSNRVFPPPGRYEGCFAPSRCTKCRMRHENSHRWKRSMTGPNGLRYFRQGECKYPKRGRFSDTTD